VPGLVQENGISAQANEEALLADAQTVVIIHAVDE